MSIRSKLAWTFILLLVFGITAISSYSILFIRNYLLNEGEQQIARDALWLEVTIQNLPTGESFESHLNEAAVISGYRIDLYDEEGHPYLSVPFTDPFPEASELDPVFRGGLDALDGSVEVERSPESDWLSAWVLTQLPSRSVRYLRVSQLKEQIYRPITTIRWIIYTGMFISMGLVILVSILFARSISRPILELEREAQLIADGDVEKTIELDRSDEFGALARSLNRMASKLRQDHEEMRRMYEKQNQFFADITHELRNPLHTISGMLEMAQMDGVDPEKRDRYVRTASRQTERIDHLFKDLLMLQRFESDRDFMDPNPFSLAPLMMQLESVYRPMARSKGILFQVRPVDAIVMGDSAKIEQVLENLVTNAFKFTNEGDISVEAELAGSEVCISVIDTGIGIPEEHRDRLFDRFYRTDKARSRDKGGTGLGLAVVRSILESHGTTIHVESEPGLGSRFWFHLPLVPEGAAPVRG
ncbi:MAG: HAMP domain-containing sensor histidine kinase [Balneolaceae bacterium]